MRSAPHVTVWTNCLRVIRERVEEPSFRTWFEPIKPISLSADAVLTIQVPSQYFYEVLEEHYVEVLRTALNQELGPGGRLEYSIIIDQGDARNKPQAVHLPTGGGTAAPKGRATGPAEPARNPFAQRALSRDFQESQLNPSYTFDTYIEGSCNRLARAAGQAVADKPGINAFNPLMIYGGVGLGKTHLIQAIGNQIKQQHPEKFVLYISSEKFVNQFIEMARNAAIDDFANYYLQVDTLIIDDVQFFAKKDRTQDIFFHIFNHLHQSGKQIVMTSDRPPRELAGLEERLLSRFKWGLTTDVQSPDLETRMAIIQSKMASDGIDIPPHVVEYLAYSVDTNVRELEGVLVGLIAQSSLLRREVDLEMAKQALRHVISDIDTEVNLDFIQKTIAEHFSVTVDLLKDKTRKKEIVEARQLAMYFAKELTPLSLKVIGYGFGGRDHTTVIHSIKEVSKRAELEAPYRATLDELRAKFR
ncbi:MAG: chromosomal replication initiator protein DnaA [Hymenobacteraceae bacterium]|nr:chromosomal replication initiator protein DnaA [Hymenobacteraceae bacterium]